MDFDASAHGLDAAVETAARIDEANDFAERAAIVLKAGTGFEAEKGLGMNEYTSSNASFQMSVETQPEFAPREPY